MGRPGVPRWGWSRGEDGREIRADWCKSPNGL